MADLVINKSGLPLWKGGTGALTINIHVPSLDSMLTKGTGQILDAKFSVADQQSITFQRSDSLALQFDAQTTIKLNAFFPGDSDPILADSGEATYLKDGTLILALQIGASADAGVQVSIPYSELTLTGTVDVGGDAGYTTLKTYDAKTPCGQLLRDFFSGLALPSASMTPPKPGEVVSFEYGGYLKLGASISAGYKMQGTHSLEWGKLKLAENYGFSVAGTISGGAKVAGRFALEVRGIETPPGVPSGTEWVEVIVRRTRSKDFTFAADVTVELDNALDGLPGSDIQLVGAMLGITTKNWFNFLQEIAKANSFADLQEATDTLAWYYLGNLLNQTFDQIKADVQPALDTIQKVVKAYNQFDTSAINLFDKYYDRIFPVLHDALDQISKLTSWDQLIGKNISDDLAQVIGALTGADPRHPLSWIAAFAGAGDQAGLQTLQNKATTLLAKIQQGAHQAIIRAIQAAKGDLGIDSLMAQLTSLSTWQELKQKANTAVGGLASRILGQALTALQKDKDFQTAWNKISPVLSKLRQKNLQIYEMFSDAMNSSYKLSLHAGYENSTEDDALVDVRFNLSSPTGKRLFQSACKGDFSDLLNQFNSFNPADPNPVLLNEAVFTHIISKAGSFNINIAGWHDRFQYTNAGFDKVITNVSQQIRPGRNGQITVFTQADLSQEHEHRSGKKGSEEELDTKFLIHFVATSSGALQVDPKTQEYLANTVSGTSASYDLTVKSAAADLKTIQYYLHFANDFGIGFGAMTTDQVVATLPKQNGNYGSVEADYVIEYTAAGVAAAFSPNITPDLLRRLCRQIVLVSYARDGFYSGLADIGRAYATEAVYESWKAGQAVFTSFSHLSFPDVTPIPNVPQQSSSITLAQYQLEVISTLYYIEESLVEAFTTLQNLTVGPASAISPVQFAKKVQKFGDALAEFNKFAENNNDAVNPVFAVFDQLVRTSSADPGLRSATLTLTASAGGTTAHQLYRTPGIELHGRSSDTGVSKARAAVYGR